MNKPHRCIRTALSRAVHVAMLGLALGAGGTGHAAAAQTAPAAAQATTRPFQIGAGPLAEALDQFGKQSGLHLLYEPALAKGVQAPAVSGELAPIEALRRLLEGSGLTWESINASTVVLKRAAAATPAAPVRPHRRSEAAAEEEVKSMPAIMVTGARTLNMDITRTEDDPQPYVVFEREEIERSGAANLENFFKQRLPMNSTGTTYSQGQDFRGSRSSVNLRGLGDGETVILIDGHRMASTSALGQMTQTDINGIPISSIERIEILPTTASGIYGGSATGGVINIVLRRDYSGVEGNISNQNNVGFDALAWNGDVSAGFNINESRTNIIVSGSWHRDSGLRLGDTRLLQRGRSELMANNPSAIISSLNPPLGRRQNIRSADGSNLILDDGTDIGSSFTSFPEGYPGVQYDNGAALLLNAGLYDLGLAQSTQSLGGSDLMVLAKTQVAAASTTIRHEINPRTRAFIEIGGSNNASQFEGTGANVGLYTLPADAQNNPFQQAIRVAVPVLINGSGTETLHQQRRIMAGLLFEMPKEWKSELDATYHTNRTSYKTTAPFGLTGAELPLISTGEIDILQSVEDSPIDLTEYAYADDRTEPFRNEMIDLAARASGPIAKLPAGEVRLSTLLEWRDERLDSSVQHSPLRSESIVYPSRSQNVASAYFEIQAPLLNDEKSSRDILLLQLAVRGDRYSVDAATQSLQNPDDPVIRVKRSYDSVDPTVALRFEPVPA